MYPSTSSGRGLIGFETWMVMAFEEDAPAMVNVPVLSPSGTEFQSTLTWMRSSSLTVPLGLLTLSQLADGVAVQLKPASPLVKISTKRTSWVYAESSRSAGSLPVV